MCNAGSKYARAGEELRHTFSVQRCGVLWGTTLQADVTFCQIHDHKSQWLACCTVWLHKGLGCNYTQNIP
jgi:hypothetical protein